MSSPTGDITRATAAGHAALLGRLGWVDGLILAGCGSCHLVSLMPESQVDSRCFHCGADQVEPIDPTADVSSHLAPPELIVPQRLDGSKAAFRLKTWGKRFWLRPGDAAHAALVNRLRFVYVPIWLMDSVVDATWQAEAGFDYQVESHREAFASGRWRSEKVERTRQDWEPRTGRMNLQFDNVPAEAIEREMTFSRLIRRPIIGLKTVEDAQPYSGDALGRATICLPTRIPQDAVNDLAPLLMELAKNKVQAACRADHVRKFEWAPSLTEQNWTKMLYPLWSTWYLDDDERPRLIFINGLTGHGLAERVPSMKRAWLFSSFFIVLASIILAIGIILGIAAGSLSPLFSLFAVAVLLLLFPLVIILFVIYQRGRPDHFRPF